MKATGNPKQFSQNRLIEGLSKTNSYVAISIYVASSIAAIIYVVNQHCLHSGAYFLIPVAGLLLFTLVEYLVHRYVYHFRKIGPLRNLAFELHDFHHQHPKDKKRLAMPIPVAVFISALLALIFWLIWSHKGLLLFAGFMVGYGGYLLTHYLIHILGPVNKVMRYLWIHHSVHHFKDDTRAYGVSSPIWDWVFGTLPRKEHTNFN